MYLKNPCRPVHAAPVSVSSYVCPVLHPLWLLTFSASSTGFPEFWGEGRGGDILFRGVFQVLSLSVKSLDVGHCICFHLLQEAASLAMAEQDTDLYM